MKFRICKSRRYMVAKFFQILWEELSCFFTTSFLNALLPAVKGHHVKKTKCMTMGDPYCEWEHT